MEVDEDTHTSEPVAGPSTLQGESDDNIDAIQAIMQTFGMQADIYDQEDTGMGPADNDYQVNSLNKVDVMCLSFLCTYISMEWN